MSMGSPGDRVVRRPRPQELRPVLIKGHERKRRFLLFVDRPQILFSLVLLVLLAAGTGLLMLPVARSEGDSAPFLTAFFTASSAITTTGLTLETTAEYWSFFGQAVILVLMFLGGLGFMAAVTFLLISLRMQFHLPEQIVVRESLGLRGTIGLKALILHIMVLDLVITAIGIVPLAWRFHHYMSWPSAWWQGTFTSVSAYNTAGFDIVGPASLTPYQNDPFILGTSIVVFCLGALGYLVTLELLGRHRWNRMTLNTRLVIIISLVAWTVSALAVYLSERTNPETLGGMSLPTAVMTAVFNGISGSTTTGFSTIDFGHISPVTLFIMTFLMFVGGAAGSTAGGTKVNSLGVLVVVAISSIKGRSQAEVFRRGLAYTQVAQAITVWLVATLLVSLMYILLVGQGTGIPALNLLFETVSAFGTVGLSTGALGSLPDSGAYVIAILMLIGRIGVLAVILALTSRYSARLYKPMEEQVVIG